MASSKPIYWLEPITISGSLFVGVLFAIGHHLFYKSLSGAPASSTSYNVLGFELSDQQINIAVGTAFAFSAKTSLVLAVSISYIQAFWKVANNAQARVTLAHLDTLFSVLEDVTAFAHIKTWWKHPTLLLIAAITWLLPIASVITPAMLTVEVAPIHPPRTSTLNVPNIDFASLNYLARVPGSQVHWSSPDGIRGHEYLEIDWEYRAPHEEVQRVANAAASGGAILPIIPPAINTSWSIRFHGPSIVCKDLDQDIRRQLKCSFLNAMFASLDTLNAKDYSYASWTSKLDPFQTRGRFREAGDIPDLQPVPLYVVAKPLPRTFDNYVFTKKIHGIKEACSPWPLLKSLPLSNNSSRPLHLSQDILGVKDGTFVKCEAFNSTYDVKFNYTNGAQSIMTNITRLDMISELPSIVKGFQGPYAPSDKDCALENTRLCPLSRHTMEQLSYRAILDTFQKLLVGTIYTYDLDALITTTNVMSTTMMRSSDLQFISQCETNAPHENSYSPKDEVPVLQEEASLSNESAALGLTNEYPYNTNQRFSKALEEMFRNITISMMSSDFLQPNRSSEFAPPPVKVTFEEWRTVYTYAVSKLWLAYGLEIFFTVLAVGIGVSNILINGASYQNSFSAILRSSHDAALSVNIKEQDMNGKSPLPSYLAKATVSFGSSADHEASPLEKSTNELERPTTRQSNESSVSAITSPEVADAMIEMQLSDLGDLSMRSSGDFVPSPTATSSSV